VETDLQWQQGNFIHSNMRGDNGDGRVLVGQAIQENNGQGFLSECFDFLGASRETHQWGVLSSAASG
jgi:hypothetical protein